MCMAHERKCSCGRRSASFHFKHNIMPERVVKNVYCPDCSCSIAFDPERMIVDNGWIIEYDMDIAVFAGREIASSGIITPAFLFDKGYCTWNGVYPCDHAESAKEREELVALAKVAPLRYLEEIKIWAIRRAHRLRAEGWRKAVNGDSGDKDR